MREPIQAIIPYGHGLNTWSGLEYCFRLAGAKTVLVHLDQITPDDLDRSYILGLAGGFAHGDAGGAGTLTAASVRHRLDDAIQKFIEDGKLIMGVCNGAQIIVKYPLLPRIKDPYDKTVSLINNAYGPFRNDWVRLKFNQRSPCIFTKGIEYMDMPIRHGEGRFVVADDTVLSELWRKHMVVAQYVGKDGAPTAAFPENPNGSIDAIAGICDETGRIFAWMPHPEAFNVNMNHPDWTLHKELQKRQGLEFEEKEGDGLKVFRNAVDFFR
ncbi:phosphoribosylformylglycinamidine synthase subunit PurQ [Candidatus Woesearchaeota archaeon]|nr:phosphoribosylformylglycinamidine synthase subunit PurQ [Candidatus Woesearchaeota archaeon]